MKKIGSEEERGSYPLMTLFFYKRDMLSPMKQYTENVLDAPDNEFVCWCAHVSAGTIRDAVRNGAKTLDDIRTMTGACIKGDCKNNNPRGRCCSVEIIKFLPQKEITLGGCCSSCTSNQ